MIDNQAFILNVKKFIDYKKISIREFTKRCGLSSNVISLSVKNGGAIGSDKLIKICTTFPELDANWLLTGSGEMLKKSVVEGISISQEHSGGVGDNNASLSRCEQEVAHLRELLAEKERLIQVLLNK